MVKRRWWIPAGVAAAALAVVAGAALVGRTSGPKLIRDTQTDAAPTSTTAVPAQFSEFRDDEAGIALSYPSAWRRVPNPDPQVRLLAARNDQDSLLLRVVPLDHAVEPAELPALQELTSRIVSSGEQVQVLAGPKALDVGGLPGYFYLYTFKDQVGGGRGVHSHYFLFKGNRMITIVFQAIPEAGFEGLAPTFDSIIATVRQTTSTGTN